MKTRRVSISVFQIFTFLTILILIVVAVILIQNIVKGKQQSNLGNNQLSTKLDLPVKTDKFEGSGTNQEPYVIQKVEDLINLSNDVNSGESYANTHFIVSNKIDFEEDESYRNINSTEYGDINKDGIVETIKIELTKNGFVPIGSTTILNEKVIDNYFEGIFNGNEQSIRNININIENIESQYAYIGLFGKNKGYISNLKVFGNITIDEELEKLENKELYIAIIAGINEGKIDSCRAEGEINVSVENTQNIKIEIAGISAENKGEILNTANLTNITSIYTKAGITAKNTLDDTIENSAQITNCSNSGTISQNMKSEFLTSGIVARNDGGTITNCTNNGRLIGQKVAGIVGTSTGNIIASQNSRTVTNLAQESQGYEQAAGIALTIENAKIENCKNTGDISGVSDIAGIVSTNIGQILQCTNNGNILKIENVTSNEVNIGGIVAINKQNSQIQNSKNSGQVKASRANIINLGGICGFLSNKSIINLCENNGNLIAEAYNIIPNEDISNKSTSCTNTGRGSANIVQTGTAYFGLIYGNYEDESIENLT